MLEKTMLASQRRNCMIFVKKKSISTSSDSNGMPACISWRKSLFKLEMKQNGLRRKNISTPFAIKQALGSMTVGFAYVPSGKLMSWFSTMNSSLPISRMLFRLNASTKHIGREGRWKIHDAKTHHPSCLPRRIFSYLAVNSILVLVRPAILKKSFEQKGKSAKKPILQLK